VRRAVDRQRASDDGAIAIQLAAPVGFAEHGDGLASHELVLRLQARAKQRRNSEQREEVGGHIGAFDAGALLGRAYDEARRAKRRELRLLADGSLPILQVRRRHGPPLVRARTVNFRDRDEPVGVDGPERPQQRMVYGGEGHGAGADADAKTGHGEHRERWVRDQRTKTSPYIAQHVSSAQVAFGTASKSRPSLTPGAFAVSTSNPVG
jgi:hypothetical protein